MWPIFYQIYYLVISSFSLSQFNALLVQGNFLKKIPISRHYEKRENLKENNSAIKV